jgi:hypothetical protein
MGVVRARRFAHSKWATPVGSWVTFWGLGRLEMDKITCPHPGRQLVPRQPGLLRGPRANGLPGTPAGWARLRRAAKSPQSPSQLVSVARAWRFALTRPWASGISEIQNRPQTPANWPRPRPLAARSLPPLKSQLASSSPPAGPLAALAPASESPTHPRQLAPAPRRKVPPPLKSQLASSSPPAGSLAGDLPTRRRLIPHDPRSNWPVKTTRRCRPEARHPASPLQAPGVAGSIDGEV